jgi:hypothetical protein
VSFSKLQFKAKQGACQVAVHEAADCNSESDKTRGLIGRIAIYRRRDEISYPQKSRFGLRQARCSLNQTGETI